MRPDKEGRGEEPCGSVSSWNIEKLIYLKKRVKTASEKTSAMGEEHRSVESHLSDSFIPSINLRYLLLVSISRNLHG